MSIKCPKCQHENPGDTIYCGKCAAQLLDSKDIEVTETIETPKEELTRGTTFADTRSLKNWAEVVWGKSTELKTRS